MIKEELRELIAEVKEFLEFKGFLVKEATARSKSGGIFTHTIVQIEAELDEVLIDEPLEGRFV